MSVSSELRLNGHVDFDVLFEMVKLLLDKGAKKNFKVNNLGPIDTLDCVEEIYGESKDYEMEFGWIYFNYEGERRFLNYQYCSRPGLGGRNCVPRTERGRAPRTSVCKERGLQQQVRCGQVLYGAARRVDRCHHQH